MNLPEWSFGMNEWRTADTGSSPTSNSLLQMYWIFWTNLTWIVKSIITAQQMFAAASVIERLSICIYSGDVFNSCHGRFCGNECMLNGWLRECLTRLEPMTLDLSLRFQPAYINHVRCTNETHSAVLWSYTYSGLQNRQDLRTSQTRPFNSHNTNLTRTPTATGLQPASDAGSQPVH